MFGFGALGEQPLGVGPTVNTYNVSVAEAGTASDSLASTADLTASGSETGGASDTVAGLLTTTNATAESGTASDSDAATLTLAVAASETGTAVETPSVQLIAVGTTAESGTSADSSTGLGVFVGARTETGSANDNDVGVLVIGVTFDDNTITPTTIPTTDAIGQEERGYYILMEDNSRILMDGGTIITSFTDLSDSVSVTDARPISDISAGSWTDEVGGTTALYSKLQDNADDIADLTFAQSANLTSGSSDTYEFKLGNPYDPDVYEYSVAYRIKGSGSPVNMSVYLVCNTTIIATWNHTSVSATFQSYEQILSGLQVANITDFSDLRLRVTVTAV